MKQLTMPREAELDDWLERVGPGDVLRKMADLEPSLALFVVDSERRIVHFSAGAEQLLGFRAEDVVGEHCLKANRCQACIVGCGISERGTVSRMPLTLYRGDGQSVDVEKSGAAFFDEQGRFAGGIELLRPREREPVQLVRAVSGMERTHFHGIVSRDPAMLQAFQIIRNVAETDTTVLIRGESGTGKELVAHALHEESHRQRGTFVAVNCAALTPTLLESELFGHVRGAFTGAARDRVGLFQQAEGGTIFLDEVAELSLDVQSKLLRVLEQREVVPVGASAPVSVDARVVAATHRSLRKAVKAGRFREDLMYRLRVVPIFLPALRERPSDLEPLLWHFIEKGNQRGPRRVSSVAPEVMRALYAHDWPGNVRELRNVVEYAFAVSRGSALELGELPPEFREEQSGPAAPAALRPSKDDERFRIVAALEASGGHLGRAAAELGVSRATLWRKRKKYGV